MLLPEISDVEISDRRHPSSIFWGVRKNIIIIFQNNFERTLQTADLGSGHAFSLGCLEQVLVSCDEKSFRGKNVRF